MKQNKYYTMNPPYQYREEYKDARFTSHSFRTGKTLAHYVDGHTENSTKTYDCCERLVNEGVFKRLSYKEAMAMIKPQPVKKETPTFTPRYFTRINGFNSEVVFLKCDTETNYGKSYHKDGTYELGFTLGHCLSYVKSGGWKEITKDEAEAMIKKEDDEDKGDILDDVYAIRCFFNGERRFTDKLTQKEAYVFRKAAGNLYKYLTKEYKLSSPKKD